MQTHSLVILALSALGLSSPSFADRGGDGNVSIIYWQAPSILNPYLTRRNSDGWQWRCQRRSNLDHVEAETWAVMV